MAYVSLYRKYRSNSFDELLGQEHITTVLRNALGQGRVAHAYLFCGPRGCGKTSTARLLARALNCTAFESPTPTPCGKCDMCVRIRDGQAIDVIEMDAASETGIDDVREKIIQNAQYGPAEARYKVYIIDEAHDLSQKAFDALLKTIEEPPAHVVFVLATTEAHRVPITIRSRCQRMDFRRGTVADLFENLKRVLHAEGVPYEPEALYLISRAAEGSFRDSLSLLEQVLAIAGDTVTEEAVRRAIGAMTTESLDAVLQALRERDMEGIFRAASDLVDSGTDVRQTLVALQSHLRDLLVYGYSRSVEALGGMPADRVETIARQSEWFSPSEIVRMLGILGEAERDLRFTNQHRLVLERTLWRMAMGLPEVAPPRPPVTSAAAPERKPAVPTESRPAAAPAAPPPQDAPAAVPAASSPEERPVQEPSGIDNELLRRIWPKVRQRVIQRAKSAASVLTDDVEVDALEGKTIVLAFPNAFSQSRADRPSARQLIDQVFAEVLQVGGYHVRCIVRSPERRSDDAQQTTAEPVSSTLFDNAAELLEGEIVDRRKL